MLIETAEEARRKRLKVLLAEIRATAPEWVALPPWKAAELFERQKREAEKRERASIQETLF